MEWNDDCEYAKQLLDIQTIGNILSFASINVEELYSDNLIVFGKKMIVFGKKFNSKPMRLYFNLYCQNIIDHVAQLTTLKLVWHCVIIGGGELTYKVHLNAIKSLLLEFIKQNPTTKFIVRTEGSSESELVQTASRFNRLFYRALGSNENIIYECIQSRNGFFCNDKNLHIAILFAGEIKQLKLCIDPETIQDIRGITIVTRNKCIEMFLPQESLIHYRVDVGEYDFANLFKPIGNQITWPKQLIVTIRFKVAFHPSKDILKAIFKTASLLKLGAVEKDYVDECVVWKHIGFCSFLSDTHYEFEDQEAIQSATRIRFSFDDGKKHKHSVIVRVREENDLFSEITLDELIVEQKLDRFIYVYDLPNWRSDLLCSLSRDVMSICNIKVICEEPKIIRMTFYCASIWQTGNDVSRIKIVQS